MICERCGKEFVLPEHSEDIEWMEHNKEVRETGMGAHLCLKCWTTSEAKDELEEQIDELVNRLVETEYPELTARDVADVFRNLARIWSSS